VIERLRRRGNVRQRGLQPTRSSAGCIPPDKKGALIAYENFLALWAHADADIPILIEAKAEYARLR
jgi:hypothetical protein